MLNNEPEPGGWVQWIEVNMDRQDVLTVQQGIYHTATSQFSALGKKAIAALGVTFE